MDNNKNFFISGVIALTLYLITVLLFLAYLTVSKVKKFDSLSKDTVLELDMMIEKPKINSTPKEKIKQIIKKKDIKYLKPKIKQIDKISKKIVKKSVSISAKQKSDLKSLFANVKIKSAVIKKKEVSNVKKSTVASRFKSKFEKQSKTTNSTISKLIDDKKIDMPKQRIIKDNIVQNNQIRHKTGESKNENDTYISKIYDILDQRWRPVLIINGFSTKVIITIHKNGRFTYRVIQFSGDMSFDNQLVLFLEKQKEESFPPPKKSHIDIEVTFTAKG